MNTDTAHTSPIAAAVGSSTFAIRGLIFQIRGSATQ